MSGRVIDMSFTYKAQGEKWNNNAIGGIGARNIGLRRSIQSRTGALTRCCILKYTKK